MDINFRVLMVLFFFAMTGCSYFKPLGSLSSVKEDFYVYEDSRILFKPSMRKQAKIVSESLDLAIRGVEIAHGKPFTKSVVVHICDTAKCFSQYTGSKQRIKAAVNVNGLFLSPLAFENNRQILFLTHELSHLHLFQ